MCAFAPRCALRVEAAIYEAYFNMDDRQARLFPFYSAFPPVMYSMYSTISSLVCPCFLSHSISLLAETDGFMFEVVETVKETPGGVLTFRKSSKLYGIA